MVHIEDITKRFGNIEVLKGVNLDIKKGEVVSIMGASGAGKTTLLQIIGTLLAPDNGTVTIDGIRSDKLKGNSLATFRNTTLGFVFQFHNLFPEFTALENVMIPALIKGTKRLEAEKRANELLIMMGMGHRLEHKPSTLSGGESQRVAIARALINSPGLLLADEPSGNLDSKNRDELHKLFFELRDKLGLTILFVTHDSHLAAMSDRIVVMKDGLIIDE